MCPCCLPAFLLSSHPVAPAKVWHCLYNIRCTCGRQACLSRAMEHILWPSMTAHSKHCQTGKTVSWQGHSPAKSLGGKKNQTAWTGLFAFSNRNVYSHPISLAQLHRDQLPQSSFLGFWEPWVQREWGYRLWCGAKQRWNVIWVWIMEEKLCLREIPGREAKKRRRQSWMWVRQKTSQSCWTWYVA